MMVQIFRLFIVCLSPINDVLCISQHFSLGHSCICDVTMFSLLRDVAVVVVVVYPTPSEAWGHGGRPWSPRSRATPQGLDQRS